MGNLPTIEERKQIDAFWFLMESGSQIYLADESQVDFACRTTGPPFTDLGIWLAAEV